MEKRNESTSNSTEKSINPEILDAVGRFFEYHPAERFSTNLRSLLLEFLMYDGSCEAEYLRELCIDLDGLFSLLDVVRKHEITSTIFVSAPYEADNDA